VADLTVDRSCSAYIPGDTNSEDFPVTPRAFQQAYGGGDADGYVTKLNPAGTRAVYSTYLGGGGFDVAGSVRVDRDGVAHVPGITGSADFPVTSGAFQDGYGAAPPTRSWCCSTGTGHASVSAATWAAAARTAAPAPAPGWTARGTTSSPASPTHPTST
jgi:hypothetical protein